MSIFLPNLIETNSTLLRIHHAHHDVQKLPTPSLIVFAAIIAITFSIVGIVGNLFTIVALLRCTKLRSKATTKFVISLAICDLLFCLIILPIVAKVGCPHFAKS